jgi:PAS domain S-box-containing protein
VSEKRKLAPSRAAGAVEAEYRLWLEHSGAMLSRHAGDGEILYVSPSCRAILGYEPDELLGRKMVEILHRETVRMLVATEGQVPDHERPVTATLRMRRKDGSDCWLETTGLRIDVPGEKSPQIIGLSRDVTEQKLAADALRANEARLRQVHEDLQREQEIARVLLDHVPAMIVLTDQDGRPEYLNRQCERLLGWSTEDARERILMDGVYPDPEYRRYIERQVSEARGEFIDVRMRAKDGREIDASWVLVRLSDGRRAGFGIDISERKAAENARREIEERTRQLNEELAEANQRKDEFLAVLAHELRNPLAPIVNAVDALKRTGISDPMTAKALGLVGEKAHHLVRLVDDLLDMSRITRGVVHIEQERIDLADVVTQAVTTSRPLLDQGGHRLSIRLDPGPLRVRGDVVRLVQVLANLLNNAAKFTLPGATIRLAVRHDGEHVEVSVRDDGIGIAAEDLPRVFDLFFQSHRPEGSLGIGLALVRSVVELHGGTVEARSAGPGTGSEFIVRLPRLEEEPTAAGDSTLAPPSPPLPTHRVLVVDDDRAVAEGLAMLLDSLGQQVVVAHDGASALDLVTEFDPDLVFIDLSMPGMDGYETARRMRVLPGAGARRVIALSGFGLSTVESRVREAGFDRYLAKPAAIDELESVLSYRG